jgi:hypothetical protein
MKTSGNTIFNAGATVTDDSARGRVVVLESA